MEVLITESVAGAARSATEELEAAGHRVRRCHQPTEPVFPCVGMVKGRCPLDDGDVDLVLTVRPHVRTVPTPTEDGITCALRRRVPVAVAGRSLLNPFEAFGAVAVDGDLVTECERIARAERPEHEREARAVVTDTLELEGYPAEGAAVAVRRVDGRLKVLVSVDPVIPRRVRQQLAVRVAGRLRDYDPYATGIDIGLSTEVDR